MSRFLLVLVLVLAGVLGLGIYMRWFNVSADNAGGTSNVTFSVDQKKIKDDSKSAVANVQDAVGQTKDKVSGNSHDGKVVSITDRNLVMTNMDGKEEHKHALTADIKITCDGKICKAADLKAGMRVRVTTENAEPARRPELKLSITIETSRRPSRSSFMTYPAARQQCSRVAWQVANIVGESEQHRPLMRIGFVTKALILPVWQRALIILTSTVVGAIVVSCLYWGQKICIPVALAVFLTFLLAPLVTMLQRRGIGRTPSAILVVLLAVLVIGGVGWVATNEVTSLADDVPTFTKNIKGKIRSLRQMGEGSAMKRLDKMLQDIVGEWESKPTGSKDEAAHAPSEPGPAPEKPVVVAPQPEGSALLSRVPELLRPAAEFFAVLALALVLVVFMLLKREDLRNRLIRLVGHGRMTVMTKAVDDAGKRISRFLVMQLIVNVGFGLALSIGLFAIQVPHALLWGLLAAVLRYIPYLGSWIMAIFLIALSLAFFPGWVQPILVVVLIAVLELVTANVVEPRLFGHSMGVSEVGLLVAAAFWTFLWGPIGLVLSGPLTVCIVVLGKYVPHLEFLDVLLGNEKALDADVSYYQRLLARDQDEATQLVLAQAKTSSLEQVYDGILVPALTYLKRDRAVDDLTDADEQFVLRATREIMEDLGERQADAVKKVAVPVAESAVPAPRKVRVLACPGHDEADRLALEILRQLLDPTRWDVEVLSIEMLSAEMVALAGEKQPAVVCIGAMPPGGLAHTRYLCKRLRARLPDAKIVVGRWGLRSDLEENQEQLREAGADQVEMNLLETCKHLNAWLPVLTQDGGVRPQKIAG